jgi:hypothetical protein
LSFLKGIAPCGMHLGRGAPGTRYARNEVRPCLSCPAPPGIRGGQCGCVRGTHRSEKPGAPSCQVPENRSFSGTQVFSKKRVFSGNRSLQPGLLPGLSQVLPHRPSNCVLRHSVFCIGARRPLACVFTGPCSPLACSQKSPMERKDQKRKQQSHILGSKRAEKKEFHDDKLQVNNRWKKHLAQRRSAGRQPER